MRQQNIAYHQKRHSAEQYNQRQAQLKIIRDRVADQQIGFNAEAAANANAAEQARYAESILKSGFATAANQRQLIKLMELMRLLMKAIVVGLLKELVCLKR